MLAALKSSKHMSKNHRGILLMTHRERFSALFQNKTVDRIPIYFFGTWQETKVRWLNEGLCGKVDLVSDAGPQLPGMDPDWEYEMWGIHGLANTYLIGDVEPAVLEETEDYLIKRNSVGDIYMQSKKGQSVDHTIQYTLQPNWSSWKMFKRFLDPSDPRRKTPNWEYKASQVNCKDMVLAFHGGSLYGWLRNWMGIESISYLMHDDPKLYEDMVCHITDLHIEVLTPILKKVSFDFVYFFEDCCGSNGPLFSPAIYRSILNKYYKKLITFYKDHNVKFALVDSDGESVIFIPLWLDSGFDIIFPVEVGTWKANPGKLRKKFGDHLKMMGGVDKHVIELGAEAISQHLEGLAREVEKGGYLPLPDHRIPPSVSYHNMQEYIRIFNKVFNGA